MWKLLCVVAALAAMLHQGDCQRRRVINVGTNRLAAPIRVRCPATLPQLIRLRMRNNAVRRPRVRVIPGPAPLPLTINVPAQPQRSMIVRGAAPARPVVTFSRTGGSISFGPFDADDDEDYQDDNDVDIAYADLEDDERVNDADNDDDPTFDDRGNDLEIDDIEFDPENDDFETGPGNDEFETGPGNDDFETGPGNGDFETGPGNDDFETGPGNGDFETDPANVDFETGPEDDGLVNDGPGNDARDE